MNNNVCFFIKSTRDDYVANCLETIKKLKVPEGYSLEYVLIKPENYSTDNFNKILASKSAAIVVYLDANFCIVDTDFLVNAIKMLQDKTIGMIGGIGANSLPISGNILESRYLHGSLYIYSDANFKACNFSKDKAAVDVRYLAPSIVLTRNEIVWNEKFKSFYTALLDESLKIKQQGCKTVVYIGKEPFLATLMNGLELDVNSDELKQFLSKFPACLNDYQNYLFDIGSFNSLWGIRLICPEAISIGSLNVIQQDAYFQVPFSNFTGQPRVIIGSECQIGARCTISAVNRVELADSVLLGANVYIADHNHAYQNINRPILSQGVDRLDNTVYIGYGTWLANNVVVAGNVHIGKGCVVGAGSYVNRDMPDYCVAVGSPARIVKAYSYELKAWIAVKDAETYKKILEERQQKQ